MTPIFRNLILMVNDKIEKNMVTDGKWGTLDDNVLH